jgi:hypothetical protein
LLNGRRTGVQFTLLLKWAAVHVSKSLGLLWWRCLFGSVVAVAFQIAFRVKMHANDVFLFFKNHF